MIKFTAAATTLLLASLLPSQATELPPQSPTGLIQSGKVELAGLAQIDNGQLQINGLTIELNAHTQWDDVQVHDLNLLQGKWLKIEGQLNQQHIVAHEIEFDHEHPTSPEKELFFGYELELTGPVSNGQLLGYRSSDNSLQAYNGLWLALDCKIDWPASTLSQCQAD